MSNLKMTADEAHQLSLNNLKDLQWKDIAAELERKIIRGEFEMTLNISDDSIVKELEGKGFFVSKSNKKYRRDECRIKW